MLGERKPQRGLFEADTMFLDFVGGNTFYAFLARYRGEIFRDEYFKGKKKLKVALDTTHILGRGAVKDTFNLLADGIVQVSQQLAQLGDEPVEVWAEREGFSRYLTGSSLKGEAEVDWSSPKARRQ